MADEEESVEGECDSSTFYFPAAVPERGKEKKKQVEGPGSCGFF